MDNTKSAREFTRERNEKDTLDRIAALSKDMTDLGYELTFGHIGKKTTYCMMVKGDEEIVGYTFIRNLKYLNENVGMLKALQQAIARKEVLDQKAANLEKSFEDNA